MRFARPSDRRDKQLEGERRLHRLSCHSPGQRSAKSVQGLPLTGGEAPIEWEGCSSSSASCPTGWPSAGCPLTPQSRRLRPPADCGASPARRTSSPWFYLKRKRQRRAESSQAGAPSKSPAPSTSASPASWPPSRPPLAEAGISLFAVSTYDTDYVLVREADLERAQAVLRAAGHRVDA